MDGMDGMDEMDEMDEMDGVDGVDGVEAIVCSRIWHSLSQNYDTLIELSHFSNIQRLRRIADSQ
jgi:hypothetical protein